MSRIINAFKAFFSVLFGAAEEPASLPATKVSDRAHVTLLARLQESGRLVDFLQEDISAYSDEQVGAAVRQLHTGCKKSLEEVFAIRPVFEQEEGSRITIPVGYDPTRIKLVGSVKGTGPFVGQLVHSGWQVTRQTLPKVLSGQDSDVLQPAEVEVR